MSVRITLTTTVRACLLFLLVGFIHDASLAQIEPGRRTRTFGDPSGIDLNPLQQMTQFSRLNNLAPMEGAVEPQEYVVGPGDIFDISVGGPQPVIVTLPVSADGYLLLPEAGAVHIADRTLAEARRIAMRSLREQFLNVRVEVTLSQPRQFYVHISGAVPAPGRFIATPVARVATVLNMAYADTSRAPVSNTVFRPSLRNIKVIHRDGSEESVDLLRYYSTGQTEHNPYIRDGDVIFVPSYDPNYEAVFVSGKVAFPGTYDHRPDDTLLDLIVLTTGQNPPKGLSKVRLTRVNDDGTVDAEIYDVAELNGKVRVGMRDQVYVLPEETVRGKATIEGWVHYPGTYPIVPGKTSLQDLVELAGGLRPGALERGAYLQRATLPLPEPEIQQENRFEYTPRDIRMMRADTLAIMKSTRLARTDFLTRSYLAHELRLQNRVPLDLNAALHDEIGPIYLQDGDRIHVPRDENTVFVLGQVNRPGYVTYEPGKSIASYIAASGGLASNAGDVYVIEAGTGRYLDPAEAEVRSGDKIFVDREIMFADTPELQRLLNEERRADLDRRSRTVQNIVSAISAAGTIITMYYLIRNQ